MKNMLLACILLISAQPYTIAQKWTNEMDSVLQILEEESLFDGQILIAENEKILINNSYGTHEDDKHIIPVTNQTSLPVFSVGKSFTAVAIMLLEDRGLLAYDDKIIKYIPELSYPKVTIRQLLTMTSGLPRFLETALKHADTSQVISNPEIIDLVVKHNPAAGTPGAEFAYNNSNYILLASIVEKVSGMPFTEILNKYIFQPLEMKNTYEATSLRINSLKNTKTTADNFYQPFGTGSVVTNATDLFKYDQALYSDALLSKEKINEAFKCIKLADGSISNYGFAWRINNCETPNEVYHVGDGTKMRASFQRFINERNTFIYIHTSSNIYHQQVYNVVRNIWEGKPYELPQKRIIYEIDTSLYKKYVGSYLSNFGLVHVSSENGKLYLRPDPIPAKEELVPSSDTTFYFKNQNLEWEFFMDENDDVVGFGIKGDRKNMGSKQ